MLLQRGQERFRLCEGEPHLLDLLACFLQDHHIRDRLFTAVVFADHKLHGHLPWEQSSNWDDKEGMWVF